MGALMLPPRETFKIQINSDGSVNIRSVGGDIAQAKKLGRIATLLVDMQNPKWDFAPRNVGIPAPPQTVTFNNVMRDGKGERVPLTNDMIAYLIRLNGPKVAEKIQIPQAGWINNPTIPPTVESLSWAANHVVVKDTGIHLGIEFSNIHTINCYETILGGTFFDKDMRLAIHKFNAVTRKGNMIKLGSGYNCYTPFISEGDMWIRSEYLEFWPTLPFNLDDGTQIMEYELYGHEYYGVRGDGSRVLLYNTTGFKTNWKINSPDVPV